MSRYRFLRSIVALPLLAVHPLTTTSSHSSCDNLSTPEPAVQKILESKAAIDKLYSDNLAKHHIPSLIYGIVYDGKLVYTSSFGSTTPSMTNSATNQENTVGLNTKNHETLPSPNSYYRIASMSKSFTAMAILQLRDRGLLNLHEPASSYYPELNQLSSLPNSSTLTIWHLLTMQSGYPQDDPWADRLLHQSRDDFNSLILSKLTSSNPIGIKFEYSNLNYAILGEIITRVSGIPYQQYIIDNICKPLGMNDTVFDYQDSRILSENIVYGYRWEEDQWKLEPYLGDGVFGAMGGIITTMNDFAKYAAYHQSVWPLKYTPEEDNNEKKTDNKPLSVRSLREMHQQYAHADIWTNSTPSQIPPSSTSSSSPSSLSYTTCAGYGLGLMIWHDTRGVKTVRHAGGLPGFGSDWRFLPDYGIAIISFGNRTYSPMYQINSDLISFLIDSKIIEKKSIVSSTILQQRGNELIQLLTKNFDDSFLEKEILADNFYLDKPKRLRQNEYKIVLEKIGNTMSIVNEVVPMNNLRGTIRVQGGNGKQMKVFYTMTPENPPKIQALEISEINDTTQGS